MTTCGERDGVRSAPSRRHTGANLLRASHQRRAGMSLSSMHCRWAVTVLSIGPLTASPAPALRHISFAVGPARSSPHGAGFEFHTGRLAMPESSAGDDQAEWQPSGAGADAAVRRASDLGLAASATQQMREPGKQRSSSRHMVNGLCRPNRLLSPHDGSLPMPTGKQAHRR